MHVDKMRAANSRSTMMRAAMLQSETTGKSWQFKAVFTLTIAAALISAIRAAFNLGYYYSAFDCYGAFQLRCPVTVVGSFVLAITFGLAVAGVAFGIRRFAALLVSFLALLGTLAMYVLWFRYTSYVLQIAEVEAFSQLPNQQQYLIPLNGATWWDVAVLGIVSILLLWNIKILGQAGKEFIRRRRPS